MTERATRTWQPGRPCPVGSILAPLRRGAGDPTYRIRAGGHWLGLRTPEGPATLLIEPSPERGVVDATAWGPGRVWALDGVPRLLGDADDPTGFVPGHVVLTRLWRHHRHWRIGRTDRVFEALLPAIIEQKVTGQEAFGGFRRLVHRYGTRAPGEGAEAGVWLQPDPAVLRRIPSWAWLQLGVDPRRARTIVSVARVADAVERVAGLAPAEADGRLRSLPGVGEWTSAEVRIRALGDADAVSFGDYHVAADVGWALAGRAFSDDELREFLLPWRPHRGRVPALIALGRLGRPRHGPRLAPPTHLPVR